MDNLVFFPAHHLATVIKTRQVSAVEVLNAYLHHIHQHNGSLNAIIALDEDLAKRRAQEADLALSSGRLWGPLHGVPITVKDFFLTQTLPSTCGLKGKSSPAEHDATAVERLLKAGAILLGKTNLPPSAQDFQTENSLFGRTNNPWDLERTCGGSTGGGAAAISAGLSPLELGGDGGGSLRIPAHFCGVFGLKPTEYRVPKTGMMRAFNENKSWRHQVVVGPLSRCVEDLRLCLSIIEGPDNQEWEVPPAPTELVTLRCLSKLRFAWTDHFGSVSVTSETKCCLEKLAIKLQEEGCAVEYTNPPKLNFEFVSEVYGELAGAEVIAAESRARRLQWRLLSSVLSLSLNPEPLVRGFARSAVFGIRQYADTLTHRDNISRIIDSFLQSWDVWICPITPGPAFKHKKSLKLMGASVGAYLETDETLLPYWKWGTTFTSIFNLTGNPVVAIPVGFTQTGLPIGVQLVGRRWQDMKLLAIADLVSQLTGVTALRPPGY
jgi:amidase